MQKADTWRKKDLPRPRQLNAKLNQCRKQTHVEREKLRLKLTKRQSETSQNVEKRRQQDSQAKKRYIALLCINTIPLLISPSFKPGNMS